MENTKKSFLSRYKIETSDTKSRLLSRSLLWMSLGLMVIILVAWISSVNEKFYEFALTISIGSNWLIAWIVNIAIIFALFMVVRNNNINILVPIFIYTIFAFYEGLFITTILAFSGARDLVKDLLIYMLIPAGIFFVMGSLAYFNVINFLKFGPYILFSFIGLLFFSLIMIFTNNWVVEMIYLILAAAIFIVWIGFDMQIIARTQENLNYSSLDKKMINRLSFMFGINLFIDFVNILSIVIRIFKA